MRGLALGLYRAAAAGIYAAAWPVLRLLAAGRGDGARAWRERLGLTPAAGSRGAVWVHGASVGEVTALDPLLRELARVRRAPVLLAVQTAAGRARARSLLGHRVVAPPLDAPRPVGRALSAVRPRLVVVAETELWPEFITSAARISPVVWVNGRISDRTFPRYRALRPLIAPVLSSFRLLLVISRLDAARAVVLGAPRSRVRVVGNLKADLVAPARPPRGVPRGRWFVAGSTRPGEEEPVIAAFASARARHPSLRLCIAPRHLGRAAEVAALAKAAGFTVARRSAGAGAAGRTRVLVLDTHGELASFYRLASAAFVGGTLVPVGGHNIMEPAAAGVPVLFGPWTANVREEARGLLAAGGAIRVRGAAALGAALRRLLAARGAARRMGKRGAGFVRSRQGVARRVVALLRREALA